MIRSADVVYGFSNRRAWAGMGFLQREGLEVQNLEPSTIGKYTYTQGERRPCIDYVLCNQDAQRLIQYTYVNDCKEVNIESDHNWVEVRCMVRAEDAAPGKAVSRLDKDKWFEALRGVVKSLGTRLAGELEALHVGGCVSGLVDTRNMRRNESTAGIQ